MSTSAEDIVKIALDHLIEIANGSCSIDLDALEGVDDPNLFDILVGLGTLHEDMVYRAEQRERAEKALRETIEALEEKQAAYERATAEMESLIHDLSAVIVPVRADVLMIPIVGRLAGERSRLLLERTLTAVTQRQARHVILDLTGVSSIDSGTLDQISKLLRCLRLLGARGVLVGTQPAVARAIAESELELDTKRVKVLRNLEDALAVCD